MRKPRLKFGNVEKQQRKNRIKYNVCFGFQFFFFLNVNRYMVRVLHRIFIKVKRMERDETYFS